MKTKLIVSLAISVLFIVKANCQVKDTLNNSGLDPEYTESEYQSQKDTSKKDPRNDISKKVCDPKAKTSPPYTIIIGNLDVMKNDLILFGEYDNMWFTKAQELCKSLGNGWRLPNNKELKIIFHNMKIIGGLKYEDYWFDNNDGNTCGFRLYFDNYGKDDDGKDTWYDNKYGQEYAKFMIKDGCEGGFDEDGGRITIFKDAHVRAVRTIK